MQAVASGKLGGLNAQDHGIALQLSLQGGAVWQKIPQNLNVHAIGRPISLSDHSQGAGLKTEDYRQANEAFFADQSNFHTLAVGLNREYGTYPIVQEISRSDNFGRLMQHLLKPETHKLERGEDSGAFSSWEAS
jgi:hypothetical protein